MSERENRPVEANGSAAAVAAMINAGVASEAKRKHHDDQIEPFKDVKRVSKFCFSFLLCKNWIFVRRENKLLSGGLNYIFLKFNIKKKKTRI